MKPLEIVLIIIVVTVVAIILYKYRERIWALLPNKGKNKKTIRQSSLLELDEQNDTETLSRSHETFEPLDNDIYDGSANMSAVGANFL